MPEATDQPTTDLQPRYVAAKPPTRTVFFAPQQDRRRRSQAILGTLQGAMHMRGVVHHYRVAADDGVTYFVPPAWFLPSQIKEFDTTAFAPPKLSQHGEMIAFLDKLIARYRNQPEPVA